MLGIELKALRQQLGQYCRGRHRQRPAQHQRALPRHAQQQRHTHHHQQRHRHLRRAHPQGDAAHGTQFGQAELEADTEHQKHHADFCQLAHLLGLAHPAEGVRPDGDADNQVAKQRRLLDLTEQHHHQYGSGEQYEYGLQRGVHDVGR